MPRFLSLLGGLLLALSLPASAAPKAELWTFWQEHQPDATTRVDHTAWTRFLQRYLVTDADPTRLRYGDVDPADKAALADYVSALQKIPVRQLNRSEQQAYWINLYNAATVQLVLERWPVKSITKIRPSLFSFGPWGMPLLSVEGHSLTLNDIEHRILRPLWQDPRIHYAVNCASIGCPSLAPEAYTADNLEALLDAGARAYVNSPRGVTIDEGELIVSSIYEWFAEDFGETDAAVIAHLRRYAEPALAEQLSTLSEIDDDKYDWSINAP